MEIDILIASNIDSLLGSLTMSVLQLQDGLDLIDFSLTFTLSATSVQPNSLSLITALGTGRIQHSRRGHIITLSDKVLHPLRTLGLVNVYLSNFTTTFKYSLQ